VPATPPPDADAISAAVIGPATFLTAVEVVGATDSTNADLAAAARHGAASGTVLITDNQTAGRGRLDRSWTTPPGVSVACSVLLRPEGVDPQRWPWLSLMTGVSLVAGIRRSTGVSAGLKWPNDVLVGEHKLCGLLAERVSTPAGLAVVLGFGINVSMSTAELPVPTATSLLLQGAATDKTALLSEVLTALDEAYGQWQHDPATLAARYAEVCVTLGQPVRVLLGPGQQATGVAAGIDPSGGLRVRTSSGERTFAAGDVIHVRR
jgi:BirA family transcriptional regulator, biotin operon repressor / biotin---[acetyl-CoA-carboxylase] ligase